MFLTEQEIYNQHEALAQTVEYFERRGTDIQKFLKTKKCHKFVFIGCGSSYNVASSAARLFAAYPRTYAIAIAGGDYLVRPSAYDQMLDGAIVFFLTRSGMTSEIVQAAELISKRADCPIVSICMKNNHGLKNLANLDLVLDWCYDRSVCQTRTVTNLYTAILLLGAIYSNDEYLKKSVMKMAEENDAFKKQYRSKLEDIAAKPWNNVVVLADGAVNGLAKEGALAFTEIAMLPGCAFCLLDYRHGPIVLNGKDTLTIALISDGDVNMQTDIIRDLTEKGGTVITVSCEQNPSVSVDAHIAITSPVAFEALGIALINTVQMIALARALKNGVNPDEPNGLDAFVTLRTKGVDSAC